MVRRPRARPIAARRRAAANCHQPTESMARAVNWNVSCDADQLEFWTHSFRGRSSHPAVRPEIAVLSYAARLVVRTGGAFLPQHLLYFSPDLHGHGAPRGMTADFAGSDWVCFAELSATGSSVCFVSGAPATYVT
jgi:hypothetical protein